MNEEVEDPGLQYERTALAYWRTMLAAVVVGLLIVRQSESGIERVLAAIGAPAATFAIAAAGYVRQSALHQRRAPVRHRMMASIVVALVAMQVLAVVVVL